MDNKWSKGLVVAAGVIFLTMSVALIVGVVRGRSS